MNKLVKILIIYSLIVVILSGAIGGMYLVWQMFNDREWVSCGFNAIVVVYEFYCVELCIKILK